MIKGGVWRNTEDEVLKAAVMKYGPNQWARIASLLHRKSAKQCKARWYEWLDPSIKKTEWSREEEEKLLQLAKTFPTQWRTIATYVGRTSAQCLEHYEYLIDKVSERDQELGDEDPRKLKPGEIDPNPETKPARPDPIDMDEDELQMLAQARARLANTQGKKAKRKAREKQMEEARRLASLQRKRELRGAGIALRERRMKKRGIDYKNEIPFEKKPQPGFYDTSMQVYDPKKMDFQKLRQQDLDGELRMEKEAAARKKDAEKLKKRKESDLPSAFLSQNGVGAPVKKMSKLVLPQPKVSDVEWEQIKKMQKGAEMGDNAEGLDATQYLHNDYSLNAAKKLATLRTPKTPASQDRILLEAQNLMAMNNMDTPLKGGLNTPLIDTSQHPPVETPNILATPFKTPSAHPGSKTPSLAGSKTPSQSSQTGLLKTPIRDDFHLNIDNNSLELGVSLKDGLSSLPRPTGLYKIVLGDDEGTEGADAEKEEKQVLDQSDLDRNKQHIAEEERRRQFEARSQVVQRGLPRPSSINNNVLRSIRPSDPPLTPLQQAEELIKTEMLSVLHYDNLHNPVLHSKQAKMNRQQCQEVERERQRSVDFLKLHPYQHFTKPQLKESARMLAEEMQHVKKQMAYDDMSLHEYNQIWEQCYSQVLYLPSHKRFTRANLASKTEKIDAMKQKLENNRKLMLEKAKMASKLERKANILLAGYQTIAQENQKHLKEMSDSLELADYEMQSLKRIQKQEVLGAVRRVEISDVQVERQRERNKELQQRYAKLMEDKKQFKQKINS